MTIPSGWQRKQLSPFGLPNIGNSCFLNAIIQIIHRVSEISSLFSSDHPSPIVRSLHKVLEYMKGTSIHDGLVHFDSESTISINSMEKRLRDVVMFSLLPGELK